MFALLLRSGAAIMLYSGAGSPDDDFFASGSVFCRQAELAPCCRGTLAQPASNPYSFPLARAGSPHARPRSPRATGRRCLMTASTPRWRMVRRGALPQALHTSPSIISWALRHLCPKRRAKPGSPVLVTMSCEHQRREQHTNRGAEWVLLPVGLNPPSTLRSLQEGDFGSSACD